MKDVEWEGLVCWSICYHFLEWTEVQCDVSRSDSVIKAKLTKLEL